MLNASDFKKKQIIFLFTNAGEKLSFSNDNIIVKDKEIVSYLDANSDEDLDKYQDEEAFESYLNKYIYFNDKD